jgi:hypothetical protein
MQTGRRCIPEEKFMAQKFTDAHLAVEYLVTAIYNVVGRWPDDHMDTLADTLRWLTARLEQGLPLDVPSAAILRQYAEERVARLDQGTEGAR